jgi:SAM-dependent methyltransferase
MDRGEPSKLPQLSEVLVDILIERLGDLVGFQGQPSGNDLKPLAADVKELSDYFTKRQEDRPSFYLEKSRLMAAYVAYFLPVNILKVERPLKELFGHPRIRFGQDGCINVLDLGCGPGTATLGFMNHLLSIPSFPAGTELGLTIVDNTSENLDEASILIKLFWAKCREDFEERGISSLKLKQIKIDMEAFNKSGLGRVEFDLILASNSLGELWRSEDRIGRRVALLESISTRYLKDDGSMVIIEPALKKSSRELIEVRDSLCRSETLAVYAPCLGCGECSMLENKKDWCHETFAWTPPPLVSMLDVLTGFDKSELKYSYLVLRKDGLSLSDYYAEGDIYRVVSERLATKGISKVYLCGKNGRIELSRLDRHSSPSNALFDQVKRGDIVRLDGLSKKGEGWRIGRESKVVAAQAKV